jgi:hypothetical protein
MIDRRTLLAGTGAVLLAAPLAAVFGFFFFSDGVT